MTVETLEQPQHRQPLAAVPITVAYGDGIGPEIMDATLRILEAAGAPIRPRVIEIGEKLYRNGNTSGIGDDAWQSLQQTRVFLKAPITTPQGGGYKSLNVTMRKVLGLYANVRPCVAYAPFVQTRHPQMDVVIIRENEEDLYAGIEHRQTNDVYQCLKLITRPGTEKIIRYAFEYASLHGRKKVTCFSKDNIMKMTDGLFHQVFDEIGAGYPHIEKEHLIIDIGAARLADTPEAFDVIVTSNLYGDIISDIAAQITGSVGLAGSANIGENVAMFAAIHGSAPTLAGLNVANPSGLLLAAVQMLVHIGQQEIAEKVQNAWLKTIEDGRHTFDIFNEGTSKEKLGTSAFADAVIQRLGQQPTGLKAAQYKAAFKMNIPLRERPRATKALVGVDVFVDWPGKNPEVLAHWIKEGEAGDLRLKMITNRGTKVWPSGHPETFCTDHWRCRFQTETGAGIAYQQVIDLLQKLTETAQQQQQFFGVIKTENLYTFDGIAGFSAGQGQ